MHIRTNRCKNLMYILLVFGWIPALVFGQVRQGSEYYMESDSLNTGGTSFSTSDSYGLGSTLGEVATGYSSSTLYTMAAGFWIPDDSYISLTSPTDINIGAISGLLGGVGNAGSTWVVTTNNQTGYVLTVEATTDPAMKAPNASIPDYVTVGANPDFVFSIPNTTSAFGYTITGVHTAQRFLDNGSSCNTGSSNTANRCWDGFSTTPQVIATSDLPNHPTGTDTTITYQVEIGSNTIQDSAPDYQASITVTATAL